MDHIKSCPRLSGKVSTNRLTKEVSVRRNEKSGFYRTLVNTCPVILERSEESGKEYGC